MIKVTIKLAIISNQKRLFYMYLFSWCKILSKWDWKPSIMLKFKKRIVSKTRCTVNALRWKIFAHVCVNSLSSCSVYIRWTIKQWRKKWRKGTHFWELRPAAYLRVWHFNILSFFLGVLVKNFLWCTELRNSTIIYWSSGFIKWIDK